MSSETLSIFGGMNSQQRSSTRIEKLIELFVRFSPSQGWATVFFLLLLLATTGWSVSDGDWVKSAGMNGGLTVSALVALGLAKIRIPSIFLHPIGILAGALYSVWQIFRLVEGDSLAGRSTEMWARVIDWYGVAFSEEISTDLLPFTLMMIATSWVVGYLSSWYLFRHNNVWVAVVLGGIAILTNLSFLPERFGSKFFLYVLFAMLLIVRVTVIQRHEVWRRMQTQFSLSTGWLTMHSMFWFSALVLVLALWMPLEVYVSKPLANVWKVGRAPLESLEDDFTRLFSGISSKKDITGRFFGSTLPFIGAISFGGEVVFWAHTDYPSYWLSRTYSEYTSKGWKSGETNETITVGPEDAPPSFQDLSKREPVNQTLQLSFDSSDFLSGGNLDWVSRNTVVRTLAPRKFMLDFENSSGDAFLPEDVAEVADSLRNDLTLVLPRNDVEAYITRALPDDLTLFGVDFDIDPLDNTNVIHSVTVERKEPVAPEVVSWKFTDELEKNHQYNMISFVSVATDDDLREASTDYSKFITDHYLQLPESLPDRVGALAIELTEDAETPLDKALAIQSFLRDSPCSPDAAEPNHSSCFAYSQDIEPPPLNADGVDHFLFESKVGYSDYFGSSMAVLLRAAGVPARMAAGYAPGEYDPNQEQRVIRDSDSHGWVQAYFPNYGWIDFEPTPKWELHERKILTDPNADDLPNRLTGPSSSGEVGMFDPLFEDDILEDVGGTSGADLDIGFDYASLAIRTGIALGAVVLIWLIGYTLWNTSLVNASPVEKAYTKMGRLGSIGGVRRRSYHTPIEYSLLLANAFPNMENEIRGIGTMYATDRYSVSDLSEDDQSHMEESWKQIRLSLVSQALGRMLPFGRKQS